MLDGYRYITKGHEMPAVTSAFQQPSLSAVKVDTFHSASRHPSLIIT